MGESVLDDAEMARLLEGISQRYHYDFRRYSRPHLRRRVALARESLRSPSLSDLHERVLSEPAVFGRLLGYLTIQVSDLFRDPAHYAFLRESVIPHLATYPSPRIWVAGCGNGEEVYSLAILLHEAGLLERSLIYATDIDAESLRVGQSGSYGLERMRGFSEGYFLAGGKASLSDYYTAAYSRAAFRPELKQRVVFSDHCLATDSAFAEVHLVSCRNVLIYFDRELQDRALGLVRGSLCPRGFLALGAKETITFSSHAEAFEPVAPKHRVYRLKGSS